MTGKFKFTKIKKLIFFSVLTFFLIIAISELLSRRPCADVYANYESPCYDVLKKYVEPKEGYLPFDILFEKPVSYSQLRKPEFFRDMEKRTTYVPLPEIRANGIACGEFAFVADELPGKAKRYVTIHENIHIEGEMNETRTNYLAARMEPAGFVETVGFSLWYTATRLNLQNFPCQLGRLWNIFKLYFLKF